MSKLDSFIWHAIIEAYRGEMKTSKNAPGFTRTPSKPELDAYFKVGGAAGYDDRYHWCGLYQTYLLQQAGVACEWIVGSGIKDLSGGRDLAITSGDAARQGLAFGDVVRVRHHEHHLMVLEPVAKGYIPSIEGNAGGRGNPLIAAFWQGNAVHNTVAEIQWRYRVVS